MQMMMRITMITMATMRPKMTVKSRRMEDGDSHSAKNGIGEAENDSKIEENDDDMLLERINRAPGQGGPRRSSLVSREK